MKVFVIVLLLIFLTSCSEIRKSENTVESFETKNTNNLFSQSNAEIIVEVTSNYESSLNWIRGKILNFRLYSDGFAEFDDCPFESATGEQLNAEEVCRRNQIKISESELNEFKEILLRREFKALKEKYNKIESSCDGLPLITVKTQNKVIEIIWCDYLTEPRKSPDFPEILSEIFRQNRKIRNRALEKEVISP